MDTSHIDINKPATEIKRILLIENDSHSDLSAALAQEGYHVVRCDSVQKAWSFVYPHRPHLIVLSLYKSDGAALAALQECRALAEGVPIVLVTSAHINEALMKALQHGAANVIRASSMRESVREALHSLQASTMSR
jgi:DNA-binding NtrC family response regulator